MLVLAALLAGCTSPTVPTAPTPSAPPNSGSAGSSSVGAGSVPRGSSLRSLTVDSVRRTYRLYRPASVTGTAAVPLVVMIHGGGGSAAAAENSYGWDAEADRGHFVVAYPDGIDKSWSVGGGCCSTAATASDDVAFVSALVSDVRRVLPVDSRRIYATGISEGGMLSYRLACDTHLFAAIGPDSATLLGTCPKPAPLSVLHVHGTADTRIPYDGSAGSGVHHIDGPSVPALNASWRSIDGCSAPSVTRAGSVTTSTARCPDGRSVELITIAGAGHQWPGAACNRKCRQGGADRPSSALDATATLWAFFAAHPA